MTTIKRESYQFGEKETSFRYIELAYIVTALDLYMSHNQLVGEKSTNIETMTSLLKFTRELAEVREKIRDLMT